MQIFAMKRKKKKKIIVKSPGKLFTFPIITAIYEEKKHNFIKYL